MSWCRICRSMCFRICYKAFGQRFDVVDLECGLVTVVLDATILVLSLISIKTYLEPDYTKCPKQPFFCSF